MCIIDEKTAIQIIKKFNAFCEKEGYDYRILNNEEIESILLPQLNLTVAEDTYALISDNTLSFFLDIEEACGWIDVTTEIPRWPETRNDMKKLWGQLWRQL